MRLIIFEPKALQQLIDWGKKDKKIQAKILDLINEIQRTPFQGKGKPEPLKYTYTGYWSRRITDEHRLIYRVTEESIFIASCFSHYET